MSWSQPNSAGIGSGGAGQSIVPNGGTGARDGGAGGAWARRGRWGPGAGREFAVRRWCTAKSSVVVYAGDVCQSRDNFSETLLLGTNILYLPYVL
jgi:hypothetical protein